MADRSTLHWNHLDDFRTWLEANGWKVVPSPPGNSFEVLRARHPQQQHPVIFYRRLAAGTDSARGDAQHLTASGAGPGLVRRFLRDRKQRAAKGANA